MWRRSFLPAKNHEFNFDSYFTFRPKGYVEATKNNYWDIGIAKLQQLNPFGGTRRPASRPSAPYAAPLPFPGRVEEPRKSLRPYRYK